MPSEDVSAIGVFVQKRAQEPAGRDAIRGAEFESVSCSSHRPRHRAPKTLEIDVAGKDQLVVQKILLKQKLNLGEALARAGARFEIESKSNGSMSD
jgi:hypothetical protein